MSSGQHGKGKKPKNNKPTKTGPKPFGASELRQSQDRDIRRSLSDPRFMDVTGRSSPSVASSKYDDDDYDESAAIPMDLNMLRQLLAGANLGAEPPTSYPSVIKVLTTMQSPDYGMPWSMLPVEQVTGSAVVIATPVPCPTGHYMLTAAHVVADQTFVQVQTTNVDDPELRVAHVVHAAHECDLAVLRLEEPDPAFFGSIVPVEIGDLPALRDRVFVAGFPVGGEELSITEGVVSRIEGQPYSHSQRVLLAVTVDAAINAGNSGGPVFAADGRLAGIAFQAMTSAENTGHIVPTPVIKHFLMGIYTHGGPDGYLGFPSLGFQTQDMQNPFLRKKLGMPEDRTGVRVADVLYGNTAEGVLKKGDLLVGLDDMKVSNNGTVNYLGKYRLPASVVVTLKQCGEMVTFTVLRDGKEEKLEAMLKPKYDLVPLCQHDILPSYYVWCGVVFQPLSLDLLLNTMGEGGPKELLSLFESGTPSKEREEVVLITNVLTDTTNKGYQELGQAIVAKCNGQKVCSLPHLVALIEKTEGELVEIWTTEDFLLVLPSPKSAGAAEANARIADRYHLPFNLSPDLAPGATRNTSLGGKKFFQHVPRVCCPVLSEVEAAAQAAAKPAAEK